MPSKLELIRQIWKEEQLTDIALTYEEKDNSGEEGSVSRDTTRPGNGQSVCQGHTTWRDAAAKALRWTYMNPEEKEKTLDDSSRIDGSNQNQKI